MALATDSPGHARFSDYCFKDDMSFLPRKKRRATRSNSLDSLMREIESTCLESLVQSQEHRWLPTMFFLGNKLVHYTGNCVVSRRKIG